MPWPSGYPMRTVTVGPFDGATSALISFWPSRSLIWAATGEVFLRKAETYDTPPAGVLLGATDQPGWIDAKTGSLIDVSAPDSHAFTYTARIQLWRGGTRIRNYRVGPFVVPAGIGSIGLNTLTNAPNVPGVLVPIEPSTVISVIVSTGNEQRPGVNVVLWVSPTGALPINALPTDLIAMPEEGSAGDNASPSVPTGLTSSAISSSGFTLSWSASSDNVAVTGYEVRINAGAAITATGLNHTFSGLNASTSYTVQVRSRDAAGNRSAWSAALDVATSGGAGTPQHSIYGTASPGSASVEINGVAIRTAASFYRLNTPASTDGWRVIGGRVYIPAGAVGSLPSTVTFRLFSTAYAVSLNQNTATVIQTKTAPVAAGWVQAIFDTPYAPAVGGTERVWIAVDFGDAHFVSIPSTGAVDSITALDGSPVKYADASEAVVGRSAWAESGGVGQSPQTYGIDCLWDEGP